MQHAIKNSGKQFGRSATTFTAIVISLLLFSFTVRSINGEFLKQLGMAKKDADEKITQSILGGYLNIYGVKNAKNIAVGNRSAIVKDLLEYTRGYVNSSDFKKEYAMLKENNKPKELQIQTPDQMRKETIAMYKKSIAETEENLRKADASIKGIFENALAEGKKQLKLAEDPNNKAMLNYAKNYDQMLKSNQQFYEQSLIAWDSKYPANYLLFVRQRLLQFLEETKDIDFDAALTTQNGKKIFVNPAYEKQKGSYWKMAFRAGKEVVEPARNAVKQWVDEIK